MRQAKEIGKGKELRDFLPHFSKKISQEIVDYANEVALKSSRYIFTFRKGKKQYAYCTYWGPASKTRIYNAKKF